MPTEERKLRDLVSIGPAMLRDFEMLGIVQRGPAFQEKPR